jgi:protein-tyrosine-phosphatase
MPNTFDTTLKPEGSSLTARVLFVCVENSNRSQMAEAFARMHGHGVIEPVSAGSRPSGVVSPQAISAMRECGYDLTRHSSKSLDDVGPGPWDWVVTMGCGDACPLVRTAHREDWQLPDPKDLPSKRYNEVRDEIERRVEALIERVRSS